MVNHAEEMAKPGITPGGYVKAQTFQHIRKHLDLVANDNTDNGRFVLEDGTVLTARFIDCAEDLDYKLVLRVDEEPPVEEYLTKSVAADALNFFIREVLSHIDSMFAGEPLEEEGPKPASTASEPSSSADADTGATEGKPAPGDSPSSDTPTESAPASSETPEDTTVTGDSTSEPAPVDPAETASEPEPVEEATASSEAVAEPTPSASTKKSRKKDAE